MEPLGVRIWNLQTGETIYEADAVDPAEIDPDLLLVISWDKKGNARIHLGDQGR